ncbi:hypothetical protein ACP4OV_001941 [Aristida adscensionis]
MSSSTPELMPIFGGARRLFSGSVTRARQVTGAHLHRVDGYSLVEATVGTGRAVRSAPFAVGGRKWQLLVYPNGIDSHHRGFVSADLELAYGSSPVTASYRVSILDYAGNPAHSGAVEPLRFGKGYYSGEETSSGVVGELGRRRSCGGRRRSSSGTTASTCCATWPC